jgi:hypothetical protein
MKTWIKMPSPAMLVALLALFVALGGSAYAVNKVGTNQIKNNAVTTPKIKNNAVTTAKVANGAITTAKVKSGAIQGDRLSVIQVEGEEVTMNPGTSEIAYANCPEGRQAIGYTWDNTLGVSYYLTDLSGNGVSLYALAPSGGEGTYNATATVICV